MPIKQKIKLGVFVYAYGHSRGSWLLPTVPKNAATDINYHKKLAQTAERGLLDFLFYADAPAYNDAGGKGLSPHGVNRLEPVTVITALSGATTNLGFISTVSTSYFEPFNVARQLASADHISGGRIGWNVVTTDTQAAAANFGVEVVPPEERYARAREFVEITFGLWDSFEPDAVLADRENAVYLDVSKVHPLNYKGKYFNVKGPLDVERSPQGRPVIAQAGGSEDGLELAAMSADVVFSVANDPAKARQTRQAIRERTAKYGREPDDVKFLPGLSIIVGKTDAEAQAKLDTLIDTMPPAMGAESLSRFLGVDLSSVPLDEPFPVDILPEKPKASAALFEAYVAFVKQGKTLRELIRMFAEQQLGNGVTGSPERVADKLEEWVQADAADGFILMFPMLPTGLEDFVELVVPELQKRGIFREEYESNQLRGNLSLKYPKNRYAAD
ncbi:LLM class flavin-dependent oxidoreductase [Mesorhizobium kowhaii]|uniref:LLM class flavin-dependent oxidoreductase n=1 Tax=Mesorhizobium kowhaii TaxID=1300272 RepID=UPI0035EEB25C